MFVYKVCSLFLWHAAERDGVFKGAPVDIADGYIHFSTAGQLAVTLEKHFAGQGDLMLVEVDTDRLGDGLKWEPSRGGALFPHLYGALDLAAVNKAVTLPMQGSRHHIPQLPLE